MKLNWTSNDKYKMTGEKNTGAFPYPPIPSVTGSTLSPLPVMSIRFGNSSNINNSIIKKSWWRRVAPCLAFLAAFSTAMALLLIWSEAAALRRQAFDANMTRDYVLTSVAMDNPQLVVYIRQVQFKKASARYHDDISHYNHNISETPEEKSLITLLSGKRNGVYLEYVNRPGAALTTSWLETKYGWRGILVLTDFRPFFKICRSNRNPQTRILHACLSTDKDTKEITYHQESDVRVTKLGEGPNSLISSDDELPTMRLKCFPLYSVLLAYNQTIIDYLNLDSTDSSDIQVLDTIPWESVQINYIFIRWSNHSHTDADYKALVEKLNARNYKFVQSIVETGKLVFMYSPVKI